jgi:hypothetical protein
MFEKASRLKLRITTSKGNMAPEDLWDLPLTSNTGRVNLNELAVGLYKKVKDSDIGMSFVDTTPKADDITQLQFDLVKHIIDVKLAENVKTSEAKAKADKKQQILALIDQKQNEKLAGSSLEELLALANSL